MAKESSSCCPFCGGDLPKRPEVIFSPDTGYVSYAGNLISFTRREYVIFEVLYRAFPNVVRKETIHDQLYSLENMDREPELKIIDVYICKMNSRLKKVGLSVQSHWGRGVRLRYLDGRETHKPDDAGKHSRPGTGAGTALAEPG